MKGREKFIEERLLKDKDIDEITFICPSCRYKQVIKGWRYSIELICKKCKKKNTDK